MSNTPSIPYGSVVAIVGGVGAGKACMLEAIIYNKAQPYRNIVVYSSGISNLQRMMGSILSRGGPVDEALLTSLAMRGPASKPMMMVFHGHPDIHKEYATALLQNAARWNVTVVFILPTIDDRGQFNTENLELLPWTLDMLITFDAKTSESFMGSELVTLLPAGQQLEKYMAMVYKFHRRSGTRALFAEIKWDSYSVTMAGRPGSSKVDAASTPKPTPDLAKHEVREVMAKVDAMAHELAETNKRVAALMRALAMV